MVMSMKMIAFWDIALYTLVEANQCFRGVKYIHLPDDGDIIHL
jgi:hypothetical protein